MFKSTKAVIALSCCLVFVMTLFMSVGYARVIDALTITGTVEYQKDPALVFIVDASVTESGGNLSGDPPSVEKSSPYVLQMNNSPFTLEKQERVWNGNNFTVTEGGWVTIYVKVKNNSGVPQYFSGYTALDNSQNPKDITSITGVQVSYSWAGADDIPANQDKKVLGAELLHGEEMEFYITIRNNSNSTVSFGNRTGEVKFHPNYEDMTETMTQGVAEQFTKLLKNEITVNYNGNKTGTQILDELFVMGNNDSGLASGSNTGDYIGNVGDAEDNQHKIMDAIFGDNTTMKIGNTTYDVWFLIKRQEVDGKNNNNNSSNNSSSSTQQTQNDLVLYITVDPLDKGGDSNNYNYVPVYAIVYTYNPSGDANNKYIQCEHLFAGAAPVCNLSGNFGANNTGNFHTHYWESTEYDLNDSGTDDGEINEAYKYYMENVANKN